jgi:hypothetical protein
MVEIGAQDFSAVQYRGFTGALPSFVARFASSGRANCD